jgi:hypothetical protein
MGKKRTPNAIDRHVGQCIRIRRLQVGVSQAALANRNIRQVAAAI